MLWWGMMSVVLLCGWVVDDVWVDEGGCGVWLWCD